MLKKNGEQSPALPIYHAGRSFVTMAGPPYGMVDSAVSAREGRGPRETGLNIAITVVSA